MGIKAQTWMVRSLDDLSIALSSIERGKTDAIIVRRRRHPYSAV
jgi:hypothetical protein